MPKVVTSSEVQNNFGAMLRWTEENRDDIVVERHGKPVAVIVSYEGYVEIERLRQEQRARQALTAIRRVREQVQARTAELAPEKAYRLAGFSENVVADTLAADLVGSDDPA